MCSSDLAPPSRVAAAGLLESGQCYRWTIHMVMDDATTNDQVSPPLWVAAPPPPFYRLDLYSDGAWSPQQTWTWCTAASVQMMVNMIRGTTDTSYATQLAIINFEHDHDRYPFAIAGSDPQGMVAALAQFGAGGYHWTRGSSADEVLRHAALALRITKKPSALFEIGRAHV